jgi:hypothetical protein
VRPSSAGMRGRPHILRAFLSDAAGAECTSNRARGLMYIRGRPTNPGQDRTLPTNLSGVFVS